MAPNLHLALLHARALGFADTSNITCARPQSGLVGEPLTQGGTLTLHQLMILIAAPCLGLTILSTVFLSWKHLHRYTAPQEQRQILRIVNLPAAYAIFHFLALCFYQDYFYIAPISEVYEGFAVAALFLLMLEYACPDGTDREAYFNKLPNQDKKGNTLPGGSLQWFQRTWSSVLQYPLSKFLLIVVQIITQYFGVYCENSFSPKHAHLWLALLDFLFVGGALGATINFCRRLAKEKAVDPIHGGRWKVYSFLGIILFQILQGSRGPMLTLTFNRIVFGILNGKLFSPSPKATYNDINFGIPAFLTCVEAVIFSLIFQWTFRSREYAQRSDRYGQGPAQRTRTWKAILDALNLSDIIAGTVVAFQLLFIRVSSRYGARSGPRREKAVDGGASMEPLSHRTKVRGYSNVSDFDDQLTPPEETGFNGPNVYAPAVPPAARDPSPSAGNRMYRSTNLGTETEYQPLTRSREPSPSGLEQQYPRQMV
ncbi:hypothetical protein BAUCODRAFT_146038 [Baudoinia panamericana UAMH 10762]|uniref:DUF300-domain-containing protein n=1 Tax=Baudoinia panamericana (strain UAMH 10762) TaxID=717646 RepID=M2N4Z2_BAUPA|nr:uncharacterized protein BAUCODRAFT_146038 [Baudoinia panamericana UAMH 10762]EMC99053.1 hypothetical protein BAUCODRAFT_146038 [Baudoinia panamericana UAMH 10762]